MHGSLTHMDEVLLYIDGLTQDCSNSIANALELLPSCAKSSLLYRWKVMEIGWVIA